MRHYTQKELADRHHHNVLHQEIRDQVLYDNTIKAINGDKEAIDNHCRTHELHEEIEDNNESMLIGVVRLLAITGISLVVAKVLLLVLEVL